MTEQKKKELKKLARGSWQAGILYDLLSGKEVFNPISLLRGRARNYSYKYTTSFYNLLDRLEQAGVQVQYTPGSRGGMYSATYKIVS